jgi:hypothetical protein
MLDKSIRELDRERSGLQSQEKKLIADIKQMAKGNQMGAVKARAQPPPNFTFYFLRVRVPNSRGPRPMRGIKSEGEGCRPPGAHSLRPRTS